MSRPGVAQTSSQRNGPAPSGRQNTSRPSTGNNSSSNLSEREKAREREREKDRETDRERERERERAMAASRRLAGGGTDLERVKKYALAKPKVPPLSSLLGYPDFYQIKTDEPEESLSTINCTNGYSEPNFLADEYGSMRDQMAVRLKGAKAAEVKSTLLSTLQSIALARKHMAGPKPSTAVLSQKRSVPKRTTAAGGDGFPRQVLLQKPKVEEFMSQLAGNEPLHALSVSVPHGFKGESLVKALVDREVPLLRATWYVKIVYLNSNVSDRESARKTPAKPPVDWTVTLTSCLFKANPKNSGEMKRWLYMVRLLNWDYYEGLLDYETLWNALLGNLSDVSSAEDLLWSFFVLNQFLDDMCKSLTQLCKFSEICIAKLLKLPVSELENVSSPQSKVFTLLLSALKYIFSVCPNYVAHQLHDRLFVKSSAQPITAYLESLYEISAAREAEFQSSELSRFILDQQEYQLASLVEDLDAYPTRGDADAIASKLCSLSEDRRAEAAQLICGWTVSNSSGSNGFSTSASAGNGFGYSFRLDVARISVAVVLLRRLSAALLSRNPAISYPLESALLQFLDSHNSTASNDQLTVISLFGELLREPSLILYEHYIRHLIARDYLSREDAIAKLHRVYLRSFPIHQDSVANGNGGTAGDNGTVQFATEATRAKNQRRIALYGLHAKAVEESEFASRTESLRHGITSLLNTVQLNPLQLSNSHAHHPAESLRVVPLYYLAPVLDQLSADTRKCFGVLASTSLAASAPVPSTPMSSSSNALSSSNAGSIGSSASNDRISATGGLSWYSLQEYLMQCLYLLDAAGDVASMRSLLVWLMQNIPRSFESALLSAVRERELIFISSDAAPQLLQALYARLQQVWNAGTGAAASKHLEKELAWYLLELLGKYAGHVRIIDQWRQSLGAGDDRLKQHQRAYDSTKDRIIVTFDTGTLSAQLDKSGSVSSNAPPTPIDTQLLDALLSQETPSSQAVLAYHATLRDKLKDPALVFRDITRRYCDMYIKSPKHHRRTLCQTMAMLLQELRAQHAALIMDQHFLKFIKDTTFVNMQSNRDEANAEPLSMDTEFAAIAALLLTLLVRQFTRLDHLVVKSVYHVLQLHDPVKAAPILVVLRLITQPSLCSALDVCTPAELDIANQHTEQLPLNLIYNLVYNALGVLRTGTGVTAPPSSFDSNSLPVKFVRGFMLNPGIQKACFSNYVALYEQFFRRLRDVGERDLCYAVLMQSDPLATSDASQPTILRQLLERCSYLTLSRCWFVFRMQLDQSMSLDVESAMRIPSDPHKPTLTRVLLCRHIIAFVLARPTAAPLLGKLVCLLEMRDEFFSTLVNILDPPVTAAPFSLPLHASLKEETATDGDTLMVSSFTTGYMNELNEHEAAIIHTSVPVILTSSPEQRTTLWIALQKQLTLLYQASEKVYVMSVIDTAVRLLHRHLILRLKLLLPLTPTIVKQRAQNKSQYEDLVVLLYRLLGRKVFQLNDEEGVTPLLISALDGLVNGRDLDTIVKTGDRDKPLVYKLRECKKMDLSASVHRQLQRVLPFMYAPVYGFVLPTLQQQTTTTNPTSSTATGTSAGVTSSSVSGAVSGSNTVPSVPAAAASSSSSSLLSGTASVGAGGSSSAPPPTATSAAAAAVPLEWRLLEDYPDTPLTLAVIGGTKQPRRPLTYMPQAKPTISSAPPSAPSSVATTDGNTTPATASTNTPALPSGNASTSDLKRPAPSSGDASVTNSASLLLSGSNASNSSTGPVPMLLESGEIDNGSATAATTMDMHAQQPPMKLARLGNHHQG